MSFFLSLQSVGFQKDMWAQLYKRFDDELYEYPKGKRPSWMEDYI